MPKCMEQTDLVETPCLRSQLLESMQANKPFSASISLQHDSTERSHPTSTTWLEESQVTSLTSQVAQMESLTLFNNRFVLKGSG